MGSEMTDLTTLAWPAARLKEAIETLAGAAGLSPRAMEPLPPHPDLPPRGGKGQGLTGALDHDDVTLGRWLAAAAGRLRLEAESMEIPYGAAKGLLPRLGPALLGLPGDGEWHFLALLGGSRRTVALLGPDLMVRRLRRTVLCSELARSTEAPLLPEVERLLVEAGVPRRRQARARMAILRERLWPRPIASCWLLRLPPGASFWHQLRLDRLPSRLFAFVGGHAVQYLLWLLAWWMVGQSALQGRFDSGWLLAWGLLLVTLVPFRLLATWSQGRFAIGAGEILKQRLLAGALRLEPEEIRHQGAGQLLGRVVEAEAVEGLALSGGFLGLMAALELLLAAVILALGAGGGTHALLLLAWVVLALLLGWRYYRQRRYWTAARLTLTHELVERLVGHRTRLAQEPPENWHDGEDQMLGHYLQRSAAMDRTAAWLMAVIPRGWLVLGLLGLAPGFAAGHGSPAALAVNLGGMLLAYQAFQKLTTGMWHLAGAAIAWEQVAPLFQAAARPEGGGAPFFALIPPSAAASSHGAATVLEAHDLSFRYRDRGAPVLQGCNLKICAGDRLLLIGPSGGGKSTLASLLSGLRVPGSGLLLFRGLDRQTLGSAGWRRRVVAAPQFHENHVLTETFAFNLLMGRRWPPRAEDIGAAERICRELGLDDLISRMPAGLLQLVGETGWQLSHGERSRLYMARALLQEADLVILDESFAALDPETLQRCLRCVLKRAATLLVIAHP
jgi:ATP-binding cassette, subfamily B, bacterial